jgi:hypothetical protein
MTLNPTLAAEESDQLILINLLFPEKRKERKTEARKRRKGETSSRKAPEQFSLIANACTKSIKCPESIRDSQSLALERVHDHSFVSGCRFMFHSPNGILMFCPFSNVDVA